MQVGLQLWICFVGRGFTGCGKKNQSSKLLILPNEESTSYGAVFDAKWPNITM
jgi:hypothetical protein